ncbi:MAG TPA: cytochrome c biogenesis protein CcdA [Mycobacteriales bacterium]
MSGLGETFARTVTDGPLLVAGAVAALVGLVSFLSPCVLPLVPGYLSYVAGLSGADAAPEPADAAPRPTDGGGVATRVRTGRGRVVAGAALFVLGFTAVFVAYGVLFGQLGVLLYAHQRLLERVLGVVVVLLGLAFLGVLRGVPGLQRDVRIHRLPAAGLAGAPVLGVVFGLGWTPCLGPTLGAVQSLALSSAGAGRGAALSAAYCLGLGVPFLLVALGARWAVGGIAAVRRHAAVVTWVGGALLVLIGLLLLTGVWGALMTDLRSWAGATGIGTSL